MQDFSREHLGKELPAPDGELNPSPANPLSHHHEKNPIHYAHKSSRYPRHPPRPAHLLYRPALQHPGPRRSSRSHFGFAWLWLSSSSLARFSFSSTGENSPEPSVALPPRSYWGGV